MKTLKYVLFLLLILIVGFSIFVAVQPNSYDVKRTKLIKAPVTMVFNQINDFKNWENWGPWKAEDPTMTITYPEKTSGVGANYSWEGAEGPGYMETVAVTPNTSIDQKISFGGMEPNHVYWQFQEVEDGTEVTWGMKHDKMNFMFKAFAAVQGGMEKNLGIMFDKGLNKLDAVVTEAYEKMPKADYKLGDVVELTLPSQKFIGYIQKTSTDLPPEEMTKLFMEFMPKAGAYVADKLAQEDYIPGTYYTKWDEETKEAEFYIGLLLKKELAPAPGMTAFNISAGKAVKIAKYGNYGSGDYQAHMAIGAYMQDKKLEMRGVSVWELYVNDPTTVKPEEIQTDIYYPVK
ncbi:SRPBCC family protein [Lacinutrix himadriensis]|uniref:SRPBCC family protein n=1 Tax=Lacinutrix himadriensis TaxID=641549 RepID=UPI0006E3636F|nr:SRPBCC family protein [Lacinutrix himadriensis]